MSSLFFFSKPVDFFNNVILSGLICVKAQNQTAPRVTKIEPPNWWAGHTINPVRLLVRGENFQNAKVVSKNSSLKVSNIKINNRGDYLFFDVAIPKNAKTGKYEFEVSTEKGKTIIPFEISAPLEAQKIFRALPMKT